MVQGAGKGPQGVDDPGVFRGVKGSFAGPDIPVVGGRVIMGNDALHRVFQSFLRLQKGTFKGFPGKISPICEIAPVQNGAVALQVVDIQGAAVALQQPRHRARAGKQVSAVQLSTAEGVPHVADQPIDVAQQGPFIAQIGDELPTEIGGIVSGQVAVSHGRAGPRSPRPPAPRRPGRRRAAQSCNRWSP